ncbi:hypothetical protein DFH09DRAFT_1081978 [Mycena vulgaris]|nr:hypothetical protein DFH09DRAFT_1081978 [Mycena vulgaris]
MHKGQYCYVHRDGHHSIGNATQAGPPNNLIFQQYFLPEQCKKARTAAASNNLCAPTIPTIHVTVNTSSTSSSTVSPPSPSGMARARVPLAPITEATANAANFDVPSLFTSRSPIGQDDSSSGSSSVYYPSVADVLEAIDISGVFEDSPTLTFPVVIFTDALHSFQITRVDQVPILDTQFYVDQVNMPLELAELFVDQSLDAMECATAERGSKGKGKAA